MDSRMPNSNDGFANNGLFADSQQFNTYDSLFPSGNDFSNSNDASWGLNASDFNHSDQSRANHAAVPSWQQNNHLSAPGGFDGTSSPYGRTVNQSPAPYAASNFGNLAGQQTFPYRQQQYDPSLISQGNHGNNNFNHAFTAAGQNAGTIAPQALNQQRSTPYIPQASHAVYQNRAAAVQQPARRISHHALVNAIPKGAEAGMFSIINFDQLSGSTNSERMGKYINIGRETVELDILKSTVPAYTHRRSRKQLRDMVRNDPIALARIGKKSKMITSSRVSKLLSTTGDRIKYDHSSSDDSSSSGDESDYSDEDDDADSPLPSKRPETPKGGVEYDVIKALWRSKRRTIDGETIRKCLSDFWEIIKTIRDRWKADTTALTDAEEKKRTGELPLLRSRVKDQREMAEVAFRAALKHGHRAIVELFAENVPLVFIFYQFLLDRLKEEDINSPLSRTVLELMAACTTLTQEKLEKTHLVKVLPRVQKKGDAKTQFFAKKILSNAETATKEGATKEAKKSEKSAADAVSVVKTEGPVKKPGVEAVSGVKRPASSVEGGIAKKVATVAAKTNGTTTTARITGNGAIKKPADATKVGSASSAPIKKTVAAKPSGFFSSLQSATKKPGTSNAERSAKPVTAAKVTGPNATGGTAATAKPTFSFAETMANLAKPKKEEVKPVKKETEEPARPEETPEQRAKRLRKEQRRKLHVAFKTGEDLVEVRYFTHDPAEEIDHDSSQMRDMSDVGGEGRMLKQKHQMMDLDDDDDDEAEEETKLVDFRIPSEVDFSVVDKEERDRNYTPYGGGRLQPHSDERARRDQHENNTLMVFYTNPNEIPSTPKEPENPYNGDQNGTVKTFGALDEKWIARAREVAMRRGHQQLIPPAGYPQPPQPPPGFDFSAFMGGQQQAPQAAPIDVQAILASLGQIAPQQNNYQQQQPGVPAFTPAYMGGSNGYQPPPPPPPQAATIPGQIDLAAILAQIQQPSQQQSYGNAGQNAQAPNPMYKTKVCRFFKEGKCQKGDACSYIHE
ncbi:putative Zinc finger, CCCH-type [Septoria linicola]|nr:putative Zinc finger, CCCH-type [Septoria linicola]